MVGQEVKRVIRLRRVFKTMKLIKFKNIVRSKKFLVGVSFLSGLVLGYVLGLVRVHQVFSALPKISVDFSWLTQLWELTPNPAFLSDIAAFEAVIIAFLVPLSIEIISKLSERYNSDVITRSFEDTWQNKILPPFLLLNIITAIVLRFFIQDGTDSLLWKILAWTVLLAFILVAFAILSVITRIKTFMSDTKSVVDQLYQDVEKSLE